MDDILTNVSATAAAEAWLAISARHWPPVRPRRIVSKAAKDLRAAGYSAMGVACDVTDAAQVGVMIDRVVTTCGKLDAAFNNAG